ncbi:DUF1499 domain-containing protein [Photobacterium profundum]|uniref:DUF1499 domain-containing protein n=1 Tax=Photobacterium profundum 3TCK TaxID=314280 RepID=Q1Z7G1_9GAMM|nr:DUF1499 domain-containing protein [Photobacterium profundum]EAS44498.1 hypothetical protein P3TCK_15115 [Photobacterium profundum 3TCK]PSV64638.1 DUF1499 domain-containing protein [Photobacterium profundum]
MTPRSLLLTITIAMAGCSNANGENTTAADRSLQMCGDKPNCVSTRDKRDDFQLTEFILNEKGLAHWADIEQLALSLSGASLAKKAPNYLHIECRSAVFGFVDDFELRLQGNEIIVRSESRTGYSDFGVNRERAEAFRTMLLESHYLTSE